MLAILGLFAVPVYASEQCVDVEGHWTQGEWVPETYSCPQGFEEFENTCRQWVADWQKESVNPVCPTNYHLHNTGNWNERCHRSFTWMHPEHTAPTCPATYSQDGLTCSRNVDNGSWSYTDKTSNNDGHYGDDVWVETTYKDCNYPEEGVCPTACGSESSEVADGHGGTKVCEATPACTEEGTCPTRCGQEASEVADGQGGTKMCEATPACEQPKEEPKPEPKDNTFHRDMRCLAVRPSAPQWVLKYPAVGGVNLVWSAMGGNKVDIEITNAKGEYEYKIVKTLNDGHEFIPNTSMSQLFRVRVYNVCKYGEWLIDP